MMETNSPTPTVTTIWLIKLLEREDKIRLEISEAAGHPGMLNPLFTARVEKQGSKKCKQMHA